MENEKNEEQDWMERTGLNMDSLCAAIETMIFVSDSPLDLQKIRDRIDRDKKIPLKLVHESISRLQQDYEQSHHGIRLVEVAKGFQFRTKATYAKFVESLFKAPSLVLSPVALEVLAIIAYKQPIARNLIDEVRGVDSSHILRALMDKRLVEVCGRSDDMGRPVVYGTTGRFLELFNLASLEDLPPEHELQSLADNQDVGDIADIKELVRTSGELKDKFHFDEIEELDALAETIKQVNASTEFTHSIKEQEKKGEKSAFDLLEEFVTAHKQKGPEATATPPEIPSSEPAASNLEDEIDRAFAKLTENEEAEDQNDAVATNPANSSDASSVELT